MANDKPKAEWQEEADRLAALAAKTFPVTGTARDVVVWLHKNRMATYKRLVRIAFQAFGLS